MTMAEEQPDPNTRPWVLVYASRCAAGSDGETLWALLRSSRAHNARLGVTGVLLTRRGTFLQVLEGDRDVVQALYARIRVDPRHDNCVTLLEGEVPARMFPTWAMVLRTEADLSAEHQGALDAFLREVQALPVQGAERDVWALLGVFQRLAPEPPSLLL